MYRNVPMDDQSMMLMMMHQYQPDIPVPSAYPMVSDHMIPPHDFMPIPPAPPTSSLHGVEHLAGNMIVRDEQQQQLQKQQTRSSSRGGGTRVSKSSVSRMNGMVTETRTKKSRDENAERKSKLARSKLGRKLLSKRALVTQRRQSSVDLSDDDDDHHEDIHRASYSSRKSMRILEQSKKKKKKKKKLTTQRSSRKSKQRPLLSSKMSLREAALQENYFSKWDDEDVYMSPSDSDSDDLFNTIPLTTENTEHFCFTMKNFQVLADTADMIVTCADHLVQELQSRPADCTKLLQHNFHTSDNSTEQPTKAEEQKHTMDDDVENDVTVSTDPRTSLLYNPFVELGVYNCIVSNAINKRAKLQDKINHMNRIGCAYTPYIFRESKKRKKRRSSNQQDLCPIMQNVRRKVRKGIGFDTHEILCLSNDNKVSLEEIRREMSAEYNLTRPSSSINGKADGSSGKAESPMSSLSSAGDITCNDNSDPMPVDSSNEAIENNHADDLQHNIQQQQLEMSWIDARAFGVYSTKEGAAKLIENMMSSRFKTRVYTFNRTKLLDMVTLSRKQMQRDMKEILVGPRAVLRNESDTRARHRVRRANSSVDVSAIAAESKVLENDETSSLSSPTSNDSDNNQTDSHDSNQVLNADEKDSVKDSISTDDTTAVPAPGNSNCGRGKRGTRSTTTRRIISASATFNDARDRDEDDGRKGTLAILQTHVNVRVTRSQTRISREMALELSDSPSPVEMENEKNATDQDMNITAEAEIDDAHESNDSVKHEHNNYNTNNGHSEMEEGEEGKKGDLHEVISQMDEDNNSEETVMESTAIATRIRTRNRSRGGNKQIDTTAVQVGGRYNTRRREKRLMEQIKEMEEQNNDGSVDEEDDDDDEEEEDDSSESFVPPSRTLRAKRRRRR